MSAGNPHCAACHGKGVVRTARGYSRCGCVNGTKASRASQRRLNSIGTEFRLPWNDTQPKGDNGRH